MRKLIYIYILFGLFKINAFSQTPSFTKSKEDTNKVNKLIEYGYNLENSNVDSALKIYYNAKDVCDKINFKTGRIRTYFNISYILNLKGDYKKGLYINIQSIRESFLLKNNLLLAKSFFNLASSHNYLSNFQKAIQYYEVASKYFILSNNKKYLSILYSNIGSCYNNSTNSTLDTILLNKAIINYKKAFNYALIEHDTAQLITNNINLANTYINLGSLFDAKNYLKKAAEFDKENNTFLTALLYQTFAFYYYTIKNYTEALIYSNNCLKLNIENGNLNNQIKCLKTLANTHLYLGNKIEAEKNIDRALFICDSIKSLTDKNLILMSYSNIKFENQKYKDGYLGLLQLININDSVNSNEMKKQFTDLETKYSSEKKQIEIEKQNIEIKIKQKENETKNRLLLLGAFGFATIAIFAFIAYINFKKTKKQNLIITQQKQQVYAQNQEVIHQKELVDEKQKEIIDSINYAKRIQQAVLTGNDVWNKISPQHFILFKPKDIVSGDFYWAYNTPNGRSIFALADCTGHGVPGGFMSMLGNCFLNEIVVENKIFKADEILNKLRTKIITALEQKGHTEQKDGMDISLCVWNKMDNTLEFSGANNPLWLLRGKEIIEYKANKMPIGTYLEIEKSFTSTVIPLQSQDIIYLSTDGYVDQFGGQKGKKFKYKALLELLMTNYKLDMNIQKDKLEEAFMTWKNKHDQVDDVAIIGIRIV